MAYTIRNLKGKDYITLLDFTPLEFKALLNRSRDHKWGLVKTYPLKGKYVAGIFEKPSTRTRVSMAVATHDLGGTFLELPTSSLQVSRGETLRDTAMVLSRFVNAIAARVKSHSTLEELARWAGVPVINMLSDEYHPLQALADVFTIVEFFGDRKLKVVFLGDGTANTNHSLMIASALMGYDYVVGAPQDYWPKKEVISKVESILSETGGTLTVVEDPKEAVKDADVIYTDTWFSMGVEDLEKRKEVFPPYQVNKDLLTMAKPHVKVMHCQPWFIGQEITEDVAYGPHSIAFEQAENRLHTAKAVLEALII
ncbi:MAG: ornithine carbamoyltransferase [Thermoproteota archaeon]|nr:MAG: ornithine carbamoyltransferase [Candidatus Korarchaeota archaeon]